MRALTDWQLISILSVAVLLVVLIDDKAEQRWCDTYQFCEGEMVASNE